MLPQGYFRILCLGLGCLALVACATKPEKLLTQIENGDAAAALTSLEAQLADAPTNGTLQLLTAHARLQACVQRNCITDATPPALLQPVASLLNKAPSATLVGEGKNAIWLSQQSIITSATLGFAQLPHQPAAMLALRASLPTPAQAAQLASLWLPALQALRQGEVSATRAQLGALENTASLPPDLRYTAGLLHGILANTPHKSADMLAALRATPPPPQTAAYAAMALTPHLLLVSGQNAPATLALLPVWFETSATLGPLANPVAAQFAAQELAQLAANPDLLGPWARVWNAATLGPLPLALQRTSLRLFPNQPTVWQSYLPALVAAAQSNTALPEFANSFQAGALAGPSVMQLGNALIKAANGLQHRPSLAAPLLQLASQLGLPSTQQAALDKLAQSLLVKATAAKDITATLALALARPQAAANNRQQVVPLLVEDIRANLRAGQFAQAVSTSILINENLGLPMDLGPLIQEEFAAFNKATNLNSQLSATSPTWLLQPRSSAARELGPLWGFMTDYFAETPEVLRGQLNALVAEATGPYGPATAMHRLLPNFPATDAPELEAWLNRAILAALAADTTLSGPTLAKLASQLVAIHPTLPLAPLLEAALARTTEIAESRALWQATTPQVRAVVKAIRPQFAALMKALDTDASNQPDASAAALMQLTEGLWLTQASPLLNKFYGQLGQVAGVYVPLSAAPEAPLAALVVNPTGLSGGALNTLRLTFLNRLGTLASTDPTTLSTTPATLKTLTLVAPYSFATRGVALTAAVLASAPEGASLPALFGNLTRLNFKPDGARVHGGTLLEATLENGRIIRLSRVLSAPLTPLLPNGQYLLSTPLEQTLTPQSEEAKNILPPHSILTLQAAPSTQPASPDFGFSGEVYPLLGTLQHPSRGSPISFTGEFNASTLATAFTFSYPLPSGQTVRAAVKCQTLAGPITCGAHHLHSPRLAYATLMRGLQTQESLTEATARRKNENISGTALLLAAAEALLAEKRRMPLATEAAPVSASTSANTMVKQEAGLSPRDDAVSTTEVSRPAPSRTVVVSTRAPNTEAIPAGVFIHKTDAAPANLAAEPATKSGVAEAPLPR